MARTITPSGVTGRGGGVTMHMEPPADFILRQTGLFQKALLDLEPLWKEIEPVMAAIEERQFDTQGDGQWPALADSTIAEKERLGFPNDPLIRSGDLKESLVNPDLAMRTGVMRAEWASDIPYAGYHQDGTVKMPQRQVIPDPLKVDDRRKLEAAMVTYINIAARETFGRIQAVA
jgi:hypothetical protein